MLQLLANALALLATRRWWLVDERPTALMATDTLVEVEPTMGIPRTHMRRKARDVDLPGRSVPDQ